MGDMAKEAAFAGVVVLKSEADSPRARLQLLMLNYSYYRTCL
jgi:hypothetical protein